MSRFHVALGTLVLAACDSAEPEQDLSGKKDEQCQQSHNNWLLEEYAPFRCDDGPACVGRVTLDTMPSCPGAADYDTWRNVYNKHIRDRWLANYLQAENKFVLRDSPDFGDHALFVARTAPTDEQRAAHEKMLAVRPGSETPAGYDLFWLASHQLLLEKFGTWLPLQTQVISDGRQICGDPLVAQPPCPDEPALFLNASERMMLSMSLETAPEVEGDGALGSWADTYFDFMTSGSSTEFMNFEFPEFTSGLGSYELAFYASVRESMPPAVGEADSKHWLRKYLLLLETGDFSFTGEVLQVDLFGESRPPQLVGLPAFELWLGDDLTGGYTLISGDARKLDRLLEVKPCARSEAELQAMNDALSSVGAAHPDLELALAAPARCAL